jgi:hypothetical protein
MTHSKTMAILKAIRAGRLNQATVPHTPRELGRMVGDGLLERAPGSLDRYKVTSFGEDYLRCPCQEP